MAFFSSFSKRNQSCLQTLGALTRGIRDECAQRIVQYRERNGRIGSVDGLAEAVKGFGTRRGGICASTPSSEPRAPSAAERSRP
jgi:hypothetical protein